MLTLTNPFFKVIGDNITAEMKKADYDTIVVSGEKDVATQQRQVRDFIVAKVSAIVLCPCESRAIGPVIEEANEAGHSGVHGGHRLPRAGHQGRFAHRDRQPGRRTPAGEAMIEALGEAGGKIAILDFRAAESCLLRVQGLQRSDRQAQRRDAPAARSKSWPSCPAKRAQDRGYEAAEDALTAHPDLVGIFAINDPSALGARQALEKAGKADQVKIIGFDGQKDGKEAIRDGKIYADPIQYPDQIGIKTAQSILAYFERRGSAPAAAHSDGTVPAGGRAEGSRS